MVKPGGRLVYATCSILRDENEAVAEAFVAAHPEFKLIDAVEVLAKSGVALPGNAGPFLRLSPQQHGTDGFFAAAMERVAGPKP